jgi:hypothetical protein
MHARFSTFLPASGEGARQVSRRRKGTPSMSEKQTKAYLMARDTLRRIRHTSAL